MKILTPTASFQNFAKTFSSERHKGNAFCFRNILLKFEKMKNDDFFKRRPNI